MKGSNAKKEKVNHVSNSVQSMSTEETLCLTADELISKLKTSQDGLTSREVKKRIELYGRNEIAKRRNKPPLSGSSLISEILW